MVIRTTRFVVSALAIVIAIPAAGSIKRPVSVMALEIMAFERAVTRDSSEPRNNSAKTRDLPAISESKAEHDRRMRWWREARFGMFIHWGLYAVPAGGYKGQRPR
ncbi:MAG TPA: alpha-L-fucosidase, partial [Blastocatellia bacterium]|nr:alpha-L-fucosidase [Blastocatellia bacterium]